MYTYSIMHLMDDHFSERCADIIDQYKRGISSCPMFLFHLTPEGDPVWDKAERQCKIFARYHSELAKHNVPAGILIQASLGHGYVTNPSPFQNIIQMTDGAMQHRVCPEDPRVQAYFRKALVRLASEHPAAIMLDDDFHMLIGPGEGCACPLHMEKFNRENGTNMTQSQLVAHIREKGDHDPLTKSYVRLQQESLIHLATIMRESIDSVDPTIQGIMCNCGDECEAIKYTAPIFAGKGNPTIVRAHSGMYAPPTAKGMSDAFRRMAVGYSHLKKNNIDIVLGETDTIPMNRYGKCARYLHAHYTGLILGGARGAKHWITRNGTYEPTSGKAYREILAKHTKFYQVLSELAENIRWVGCNSAFIEQLPHPFFRENVWKYHENTWATKFFERIGVPFYFSDSQHEADFLEAGLVEDMTDAQIKETFQGSVFLTGEAALILCRRGYGHLLGVEVTSWDGPHIDGELLGDALTCTKQKNAVLLKPVAENVETLSYNYRNNDGKKDIHSPAVTLYDRGAGKLSVVFCGTPDVNHVYTEGFAFANESRKKQLVDILLRANVLPVYCKSDNEMMLRAGYRTNGNLLCCLTVISYDPEENVTLYLDKAPSSIRQLLPNGTFTDIRWEKQEQNTYVLDIIAEPLYPLILDIQ